MSAGSPEQIGQVMPPGGNANARRRNVSTRALGLSSGTIDARRQMAEQMAEMEHVFRPAGDQALQMEALATLRRWQVDPRLDSASRDRASALVWKFQPNGWDEV